MNKVTTSLAEKAYGIIEEMIVTLVLAPGTVFSEGELSKQIDIGRTPLREALQKLAAARLVVTMPRRGMMVTEVNFTEHLVLLETRRELDRLIASRAARRGNPQHREQLQGLATDMMTVAKAGKLAEFMRLDRTCDEILEIASRNPFAARACAPLHAHCRRFWYLYQRNGDLNHSATLHAELMRAVAGGDESAAAEASDNLMDYLDRFTRTALETF